MWNVIINPKVGQAAKKGRYVSKYFKKRAIQFAVYFSDREGLIEELAEEISEKGEKDFIIIGDERAVSEFANGVKNLSSVRFGVIPSSSKNSFCRALNLPSNKKLALEQILEKQIYEYDYMTCNNKIALNTISCGIDVAMLQSYMGYRAKNNFGFWRAIFANVFAYSFTKINVESAEYNVKDKEIMEFAVCNGKYFAKNIKINPHSNMTDGKANMIVVSPIAVSERLKSIRMSLSGKHLLRDEVEEYWCSEVTIKNKDGIKINIDGKIYELVNPQINVVPLGLKVYSTKKNTVG